MTTSLFIRLYLDEDVNVLVADLLKAREFDAITARDANHYRILGRSFLSCLSARRKLYSEEETKKALSPLYDYPGSIIN